MAFWNEFLPINIDAGSKLTMQNRNVAYSDLVSILSIGSTNKYKMLHDYLTVKGDGTWNDVYEVTSYQTESKQSAAYMFQDESSCPKTVVSWLASAEKIGYITTLPLEERKPLILKGTQSFVCRGLDEIRTN